MKIKTYDGGHYLKACNSITYWAIDDNLFIELNTKSPLSLKNTNTKDIIIVLIIDKSPTKE